jgi:predicted transcriptional regulator
MEDYVQILELFPKDKSLKSYLAIRLLSQDFATEEEVNSAITYFKNKGYIQSVLSLNGDYRITDKGLDLLADDRTPEEYIIRKLIENNGYYNLNLLDGKRFKNETERFATIQKLEKKGVIEKVERAIGNTYMLTDSPDEKPKPSVYIPENPLIFLERNGGKRDSPFAYTNVQLPKKIEQESQPKKFWKLINTHPIWTTVIGGVILAVILKLLHLV